MARQTDSEGQVYFDGDFLITAADLAWITQPVKLPREASQPLTARPARPRADRPRKSTRPSNNVAK